MVKAICINKSHTDILTVGQEYDVTIVTENSVYIRMSDGYVYFFPANLFDIKQDESNGVTTTQHRTFVEGDKTFMEITIKHTFQV